MITPEWVSIRSLRAGTASIKVMALALLMFMLSNCGGGGSNSPAFDSGTTQLMQTTLNAGVSEMGIPGATMTIVRPDGAKWTGVSGFSDLENRIPMSADLKFRIASITKTFTATVILQLVQEGRFSLNDSLESILPGLISNGNQISVRRLLNHTSGIFDYVQSEKPNFLLDELNNLLRHWMPEELIAVARGNPAYFAPGGGFHYSNTNYALLGMIIEKVTGSTYAREIRSRILVPLGLKNTSVAEVSEMPAGSTRGYTYKPTSLSWVNTTTMDPSWLFGTGSIVSDREDLLVWLNALLAGALLDQQRKAEMFTFVDMGVPNWGYGLGLENQNGVIGHTGDAVFGGQSAMYDYKGWRFVVLTNASPSKGSHPFGTEYIMYKAMRAIGLLTP